MSQCPSVHDAMRCPTRLLGVALILACITSAAPASAAAPDAADAAPVRHAQLPPAQATTVTAADRPAEATPAAEAPAQVPPGAVEQAALRLLHDKGLLSDEEYDSVRAGRPVAAEKVTIFSVLGKWAPTIFGFVEFDSIYDSTQSFSDVAGNAPIARPQTYAGEHGRMIFGVRNSRLGFNFKAPKFLGISASALIEMDFLGNQPPTVSEAAFFTSPTFRLRQYFLKLQHPVVGELLIGQAWQIFGWQPDFNPTAVEVPGVPGQVLSRSPQIRVSRTFKGAGVSLELAAAAVRPVNRDSWTPDGQAGLKLSVDGWQGLHTVTAVNTVLRPMTVGVSGLVRRIDLPEFTLKPQTDVSVTGWGVSVNALVPIVTASKQRRAHALTAIASFVYGHGIADQFTGLTGNVGFPTLSSPDGMTPQIFVPDVDNGLAVYDKNGELHAIHWQSFLVGLEYYLPPAGQVWISANYSQMNSNNAQLFGSPNKVFTLSRWADLNLFWDVTPAVRIGAEYAWYNQVYADADQVRPTAYFTYDGLPIAQNHRGQLSAYYLF